VEAAAIPAGPPPIITKSKVFISCNPSTYFAIFRALIKRTGNLIQVASSSFLQIPKLSDFGIS